MISRRIWLLLLAKLVTIASWQAASLRRPHRRVLEEESMLRRRCSMESSTCRRRHRWESLMSYRRIPLHGKTRSDDELEGASDSESSNKADLYRAVGEQIMRNRQKDGLSQKTDNDESLLDKINPFKAGQNLRKSIDTALTSFARATTTTPDTSRSPYYLDDRLTDHGTSRVSSGSVPYLSTTIDHDYIPEVLVVGATGQVGRLVVRRLLRDGGRFRVRVLVRDLYTHTLNVLGTGVTYCQGDLTNVDSLEYALTDVDKIVFCASAPQPDEPDFQRTLAAYVETTTMHSSNDAAPKKVAGSQNATSNSNQDDDWDHWSAVLEVRARLAEQVDCVGMQNLVRAYQHVRHADYGTSQAAKRSLFKFQDRPEDFNVFELESVEDGKGNVVGIDLSDAPLLETDPSLLDHDTATSTSSDRSRRPAPPLMSSHVQWTRNKFGHAAFVGRVPRDDGQAAIVSTRLRARGEEPDRGIDLSGFGGFILRLCADGGHYEAFVRTAAFETRRIEYVCPFSTSTKLLMGSSKSRNKFTTVRLPFESFVPTPQSTKTPLHAGDYASFDGTDVRQIGFRFCSASNTFKARFEKGPMRSFYVALSYIKLYRTQPEPEFIYVSDARIPPLVRNGMVRHDVRQLVPSSQHPDDSDTSFRIWSDSSALDSDSTSSLRRATARSLEETYYKFRGEDILKKSGLSYAIIRVAGFNEIPSGEASTIELTRSNHKLSAVSRDEVAQVCASALLDPNALNKSFYIRKRDDDDKAITALDEDMSQKFQSLPADSVI